MLLSQVSNQVFPWFFKSALDDNCLLMRGSIMVMVIMILIIITSLSLCTALSAFFIDLVCLSNKWETWILIITILNITNISNVTAPWIIWPSSPCWFTYCHIYGLFNVTTIVVVILHFIVIVFLLFFVVIVRFWWSHQICPCLLPPSLWPKLSSRTVNAMTPAGPCCIYVLQMRPVFTISSDIWQQNGGRVRCQWDMQVWPQRASAA